MQIIITYERNKIEEKNTKKTKSARRELNESTFCFNKQHEYKNSQALNGDDDSRIVFFSAHSHILLIRESHPSHCL